jgi:hypothetical protein
MCGVENGQTVAIMSYMGCCHLVDLSIMFFIWFTSNQTRKINLLLELDCAMKLLLELDP